LACPISTKVATKSFTDKCNKKEIWLVQRRSLYKEMFMAISFYRARERNDCLVKDFVELELEEVFKG
jgi:hypothetical protein